MLLSLIDELAGRWLAWRTKQAIKEWEMRHVINKYGGAVDFLEAFIVMDASIRRSLINDGAWSTTCQAFFTAYEDAHAAKYGEWELSRVYPVWPPLWMDAADVRNERERVIGGKDKESANAPD